jgi:hypothetical protein
MRATTTADLTRSRPRRAGRVIGAVLAASALVAGVSACGDDASDDGAPVRIDDETTGQEAAEQATGEFEATASYLKAAAEQSAGESYRAELQISMTGEIDESAPPFMSGVVDGDRYHYTMDMAGMMSQAAGGMGGSLPPELEGVDLSIEMAGDPETLYLRAPIYGRMGTSLPGEAAGLAEIGDGWGRVDMAALGEQLPTELASAVGSQGVDPRAVIEMIEGVEGVEDLGTGEVRGETVHGMSADLTLADMIEASGQDPEALADVAVVDGTEDAAEAMYDIAAPITVWVGDDGYLRRLEFGFSMSDVAEAVGEDPTELSGLGFGDIRYAMDMYDYGATIDFEPPADAVDITDAFAALAEM